MHDKVFTCKHLRTRWISNWPVVAKQPRGVFFMMRKNSSCEGFDDVGRRVEESDRRIASKRLGTCRDTNNAHYHAPEKIKWNTSRWVYLMMTYKDTGEEFWDWTSLKTNTNLSKQNKKNKPKPPKKYIKIPNPQKNWTQTKQNHLIPNRSTAPLHAKRSPRWPPRRRRDPPRRSSPGAPGGCGEVRSY